ncbi:MAG: hypothetical protein E4H36_04615 [Spirochaetales bacterium]|nr:MAG: hypothetical protein E4H36_04615 [Spirochaetales bacterium]
MKRWVLLPVFLCTALLLTAQQGPATTAEKNYEKLRMDMAERLNRQYGIRKESVLAILASVPRHLFVPSFLVQLAYEDTSIPLGRGELLPEPAVTARILDAIEGSPGSVLIAGMNTVYMAALISRMAGMVRAVEFGKSGGNYQNVPASLGYNNILFSKAPDPLAWADAGPFDVVIVHGALTMLPEIISRQIKPGGDLFVPLDDGGGVQQLIHIKKNMQGSFIIRSLGSCFFAGLEIAP